MPARRLDVFTAASVPGAVRANWLGVRPVIAAHVNARLPAGHAASAEQSRTNSRRLNGGVWLDKPSRFTNATSAADLVMQVDVVETLVDGVFPTLSNVEEPPDASHWKI